MLILPDHAMPLQGLIGGLMIGIASAVLLLGVGRIAGVSGMAARALGLSAGDTPKGLAWAFIIGLPIGAGLAALLLGPIVSRFPMSSATLVAAGLIVGIGTRIGSGCTSGHGVCGLSRLSPRAIAATLTFMVSGFATVALVNMLGGGW